MPATVKILVEGYYTKDANRLEHACPTVTLVRDNGVVLVVDPGTADPQQIADALKKEGLSLSDVTVVGITHSHIDHSKNAGLFPLAAIIDYSGVWKGDTVQPWQEKFSENIRIIKTPGHDATGITFFADAGDGTIAICGDVFWKEDYPLFDPHATDLKKLAQSRKLVLKVAQWVIPGHGKMFQSAYDESQKPNGAPPKKPVKIERCKKCRVPFVKPIDRCACQEWLCFRCCECERDCLSCNCEHHV